MSSEQKAVQSTYSGSGIIFGDRESIEVLLEAENLSAPEMGDQEISAIGKVEYQIVTETQPFGDQSPEWRHNISMQWFLGSALREPSFKSNDVLFQQNRCFMLVYNAQNKAGFEAISQWLSKVSAALDFYNIRPVLVGTHHSDLATEHSEADAAITIEQGKELASKYKINILQYSSPRKSESKEMATSPTSSMSSSSLTDQGHDAFVTTAKWMIYQRPVYAEHIPVSGVILGTGNVKKLLEDELGAPIGNDVHDPDNSVVMSYSSGCIFSPEDMGTPFSKAMTWRHQTLETKGPAYEISAWNHPGYSYLLVYDARNRKSFDAITDWLERETEKFSIFNTRLTLMGLNYEDSSASALQVREAEARSLARGYTKYGMNFFPIPTKSQHEAFVAAAKLADGSLKKDRMQQLTPEYSFEINVQRARELGLAPIPMWIEFASIRSWRANVEELTETHSPEFGLRIHAKRDEKLICSAPYNGSETEYWTAAHANIKKLLEEKDATYTPKYRLDSDKGQGYIEFSTNQGQSFLHHFINQGYCDSHPGNLEKLKKSCRFPAAKSENKSSTSGNKSPAGNSVAVSMSPSHGVSRTQSTAILISPNSQQFMPPPNRNSKNPNKNWKDAGIALLVLAAGTGGGVAIGSNKICGLKSVPNKLVGGGVSGAIVTLLILAAYGLGKRANSAQNTSRPSHA